MIPNPVHSLILYMPLSLILDRELVNIPQIIKLANIQTIHSQDVIRRRDVKEEIRQRIRRCIAQPGEFELVHHYDLDVELIIKFLLLDLLEEVDCLLNA